MIQVQLPSVGDPHDAAEAAELILIQIRERIRKWRCSGHEVAPHASIVQSGGTTQIEVSTCCKVFEDQVAQALAKGRAAA